MLDRLYIVSVNKQLWYKIYNHTMHLEQAKKEDVELIKEMWYKLAKEMESYSKLNKIVYSSPQEVPESEIIDQIENNNDIIYSFIVHEGIKVGFIKIYRGYHESREYSKYIDITDLYVLKEYRNRGYGSIAINKIKRIAKDTGCDIVKVSCEHNNTDVQRLYDKEGFEKKQIEFFYEI